MQLPPIDRATMPWRPQDADAQAVGAAGDSTQRVNRVHAAEHVAPVVNTSVVLHLSDDSLAADQAERNGERGQQGQNGQPNANTNTTHPATAGKNTDPVAEATRKAKEVKEADRVKAEVAKEVQQAERKQEVKEAELAKELREAEIAKEVREAEEAKANQEPISKQLLDFVQSMWRASAQAIDGPPPPGQEAKARGEQAGTDSNRSATIPVTKTGRGAGA